MRKLTNSYRDAKGQQVWLGDFVAFVCGGKINLGHVRRIYARYPRGSKDPSRHVITISRVDGGLYKVRNRKATLRVSDETGLL
jgi:hypothetical protein